MDTSESSRTVTMNYTYEIKDSIYSPNGIEITEYLDDKFHDMWYLVVLKNGRMGDFPATFDSFERTRNWVLQNYPELLL